MPTGKRPQNKNYATNASGVNGKLTTSKLQFFSVIIFLLKLLLNTYESDYPLVSLIYDDVLELVNYLRLIIKQSLVSGCPQKEPQTFDSSKKKNYLSLSSINIGCTARIILSVFTHFSPIFYFYTPWKRAKTFGFLMI